MSEPVARRRQSSIGPVTDPAPDTTSAGSGSAEDAAAFLTRNAVDALPKGALARQLGEGRPLRVKLGIDPTAPDIHLGHLTVNGRLTVRAPSAMASSAIRQRKSGSVRLASSAENSTSSVYWRA